MIARLTYLDGDGNRHTATLEDDCTWTGDDAETVESLNALIATEDRSPARGDWAGWHAERMAGVLGAEVEFAPTQPAPADMLY